MNKDFDKLREKKELYDSALGFDDTTNISENLDLRMTEQEDIERFKRFDGRNGENFLKKYKESLSSSKCITCNRISISILDDIYLTKHGKCQKCFLKEEKLF